MAFGNVLVIGNSGVGKSTLIKAVLGEDGELVNNATGGTTGALEIRESKDSSVPFRIIDTIGFEPAYLKRRRAIKAVKDWSKRAAKDGDPSTDINVIWFCVDGCAKKLFPDAIASLSKATSLWESVPVVVVITKSYSQPEREENVQMVHQAFAQQRKYSTNLRGVIPVVAETYRINDTAYAAPDGITDLIDRTNELMPEGRRAAKEAVANFKLRRKRAMANGVVGAAATSAAAVGALPMPIADALILQPIEVAEVNALSAIFEMPKGDASKKILDTIIEVGTVSVAAKTAISALKGVPGVNLAASVLNAIMAGGIAAAIGEGSAMAFEQVYLGNKSPDDLDWLRKLLEAQLSKDFIKKMTKVIEKVSESGAGKNPAQLVSAVIEEVFS